MLCKPRPDCTAKIDSGSLFLLFSSSPDLALELDNEPKGLSVYKLISASVWLWQFPVSKFPQKDFSVKFPPLRHLITLFDEINFNSVGMYQRSRLKTAH